MEWTLDFSTQISPALQEGTSSETEVTGEGNKIGIPSFVIWTSLRLPGLGFLSSSCQVTLVEICFGTGVCWGRVLHFLHFYFCLLISQPEHWDHLRPLPEGPGLRSAFWGAIEAENFGNINSPSVLLQSFQGLASNFSDRFLSFHPVYFHTALSRCEDSELFSEQETTSAFPLYSA